MNYENTQILLKKYKNLFLKKKNLQKESIHSFGFECNDGWFSLIDETLQQIQDVLDIKSLEFQKDFYIEQIKEKFGEIRIYTSIRDKTIESIISEAEVKSSQTCEICGKPGQLIREGYLFRTVCEKHTKKNDFLEMQD